MRRIELCMCSAERGKEHHIDCPYAYYGDDGDEAAAWLRAWQRKHNERVNRAMREADILTKFGQNEPGWRRK